MVPIPGFRFARDRYFMSFSNTTLIPSWMTDWATGHTVARSAGNLIRKVRPGRALLKTFVIGFAALVVSGIGHALFHPVQTESTEAARLVSSLAEGRADLDVVPTNFESELGYRPILEGEALVNPRGGCSAPSRIGPKAFDTPCRTHDLGYDTLRYAEATGIRLGAWARLDLDRRFYADLLQTCETVTCKATATAYFTAVTANSIRQGYKAPMAEPTMPWVGVALGVVVVSWMPPFGAIQARRTLEVAVKGGTRRRHG